MREQVENVGEISVSEKLLEVGETKGLLRSLLSAHNLLLYFMAL